VKDSRPLEQLPPALKEVVDRAIALRERAYAPYSHFHVGCAIRTVTGEIFGGVNVENASYSATVCAERSTIVQMVAAGQREIDVVAIAAGVPAMPCGVCLQTIREFGPDSKVVCVSTETRTFVTARLSELFPFPFSLST